MRIHDIRAIKLSDSEQYLEPTELDSLCLEQTFDSILL